MNDDDLTKAIYRLELRQKLIIDNQKQILEWQEIQDELLPKYEQTNHKKIRKHIYAIGFVIFLLGCSLAFV